jgi:GrpB-like predicted nucleotidyltransferase (UPF0157 family)
LATTVHALRVDRLVDEAHASGLHVIENGHPHADALIGFRDALRTDADLCRDYTELKRRLAAEHDTNRNAYSNAKNDFVARALRQIGLAVPPRDRLPE